MEKKTLEISIPEGKKPKMTEGTDKCVIEWVQAEKTFGDYVTEYRNHIYDAIGAGLTSNCSGWRNEFKFGLLQFIADDLNEEPINWDNGKQDKYVIYYHTEDDVVGCDVAQHCKRPGYVFTYEAYKKAIKIIPKEFFKSF